ncbi:alpha/beta fold hydrolase [Glycomyces harbinensis]|uniref:Alpha/beta hydrolase family protein n=1 Tax=Glycomyces harbinensis TaxID=58114 RepID=A0A1G7DPD6_9ACTN|nr:alpha/beta hydrolase [Glycomyces harbinensis]SDE53351.1 Alpha/beta hydrolase family protein [Glycomyces harbinensis]
MTPTIVFIHGSNANSFTFAPLQRELALLGRRSFAVDLPGHGFDAMFPEAFQTQDAAGIAEAPSNLAGVTLQDGVDHLVPILKRAKDNGPVIVLAHSRGGATLSALGNAHPELIDRMVYATAWCPIDRPIGAYMALPEFGASVLDEAAAVLAADPSVLGAIRMNWRTGDPKLLAVLKESMLADGSDDEFRVFLASLQSDENLDVGGDARVNPETWGRIPKSYIRITKDTSIPVALQDVFIKEGNALTPDNPWDVHTIETSHVGFLVRPERMAAILAGLA